MNAFDKILKNTNEIDNFVFDVKKYEQLEKEYFFKFSDLPPVIMGYNYKHPIYTMLMEKAIKNNKKIDDDDIVEIEEEYNFEADLIKE